MVNTSRQDLVASIIVGVVVPLSLILPVTTVFPKMLLGPFILGTTILGAPVLGALGADSRRRGRGAERQRQAKCDRQLWRMPPLPTLGHPGWSLGQKVVMCGLRGDLVPAVLVVGLKIGQLAPGH